MGLLDDAIREHLDLKRRRGADPAEVARMEHEALGPVRREPVPADDASAHDVEPDTHDAPPGEQHDERPHAVEPHEHDVADAPHAPAPEERHDPPHGDPLFEHHDEPVLQPTTEYRVEDHHDDEVEAAPASKQESHGAADPDDDVLEETPDFLQETPEHDRLWFEQRPPRDFDFDG